MKIAHLSDLHFAPRTLDEACRCFESAIEQAVQRGAECAAMTGDATDHPLDVHAPAFHALVRGVRRLADHCPVIVLQGTYSHEPPGTLNVLRYLGGRWPVFVADRICQVALLDDGSWLASDGPYFASPPPHTAALFSCMPTVNQAAVAACAEADDGDTAQLVAAVLRGFGPCNELARSAGIPTIGLAHGTVNGCVTEHGLQMAGLDHEFSPADLFEARTSAFMLGHIHRHQSWSCGSRQIAYAGSIGRFHFGEQGDKGFLLWDVSAAGAQFSFIATPARRTMEFDFSGPVDMEQLRREAPALAGARVRIRYVIDEQQRDSVNREEILRILSAAAEVKIEARIVPSVRSRTPGIGACPTVEGKLTRWADAVGADAAPLLERLRQLLAQSPEQIAQQVLTCAQTDTADPQATELARFDQQAAFLQYTTRD